MSKQIIHTDLAPEALGPYSQAVVANQTVYCSGQIGIDPKSMTFVSDDVVAQTKQVMQNLAEVLKAANANFSTVLKTSIFLANMDDFAAVNEVYASFFTSEPPARETVAVKTLPKNAKVEISCIAIQA